MMEPETIRFFQIFAIPVICLLVWGGVILLTSDGGGEQ